MKPLTLMVAQVRSVPFDPEATLAKFESEVRTAVEDFPNIGLIVFPELYLTGEHPFSPDSPKGFTRRVAEPVPGPLTDRVSKIAASAERWIVAGSMFERDGDDIYNTGLVFSPSGELVVHRKLVPWEPWEAIARGSQAPPCFDIPGVGRVGILICYESWFPESWRSVALEGAELIVTMSLTTTSDRDQELVITRAAAIANQCYAVNVNAVSTIGGGRSIAVDPEGRDLFVAGAGEELITEVIDFERVELVRERGTQGLSRVWKHLHQAPPALFRGYERFLNR
jgi:formamidase